jgi:uncharacterized RDD family membrane protein YckC
MENFWGQRFKALLVDIVIITLLLWIISSVIFLLMARLGIFSVLNYWIFIGAILIIVYFTYMEGKTSSTLGKRLFKLKVKAKDGDMNYKKAFIRNLSKILWLPLIVDVILGFIFVDSNDRILDEVSRTYVVNVEESVNKSTKLKK